MADIKKLDQATILKLAAGEIIDRPVSIVKELVENAIDAKASKINVAIKQGGIAEIVISDNGSGIRSNQLLNAIEAHATSKLNEFDDLETVYTMGFRGEALASIAAVSEIQIHSYNTNDDLGSCLTKVPGDDAKIMPKARDEGTTITVSHLFKRIPVRFRFLKSATSEATLITRLIQQFSLHYPAIGFELTHNSMPVFNSSPTPDLSHQFQNVVAVKPEDVVSFSKQTNDITVSGVATSPNKVFKNRSKCWFSVNGRMVKSPMFLKAVDAAYLDAIPKGSYPAIVCLIECPTVDVDINIHPKKEDVKFSQQDEVFIAIKRAVKQAVMAPAPTWEAAFASTSTNAIESSGTSLPIINQRDYLPEKSTDKSPLLEPTRFSSFKSDASTKSRSSSHDFNTHTKPTVNANQVGLNKPPVVSNIIVSTPALIPKEDITRSQIKWLSLNKKYIIVPIDDELLIFDQHAVHERVLYDKFKAECESSQIVSMPLLIPEYIPLSSVNKEYMLSLIPSLKAIGIDIEAFDDTQLIVREVPQLFSTTSIKTWLDDWFDDSIISNIKDSSNDEKLKMLQMKACKAAVKSGQLLKDAEVQHLLEMVINSDQQFTCPHGRPLYIKMSESKLDSLFLRS